MPRPSHKSDLRRSNTISTKPGETPKAQKANSCASTNPIVLLVDDDPAVLESLGRVLVSEGWRVVTAANGEEALARLAEQQPDLMITDLCMVGINGWDLLFHEKMQRPDLPVFVITALPPSSAKGADHFATDFFQKPLDIEVMVAAIHRRLGDSLRLQPQR